MARAPVDVAFDEEYKDLFAVCDDGTVWALKGRAAIPTWQELGEPIDGEPVGLVFDRKTKRHLHVACKDGAIWTLDLDSQKWSRALPLPGSSSA